MAADEADIAPPRAGTYRIDPARSTVHYSSKHIFGMGTVYATFGIKDGVLEVGDPITTSAAKVTVDADSFTSNMARRDRDVRSAGLLDTATYPDITFVSERLQESGDVWMIPGTVVALGQSVPVQVQVDRVTPEGSGVRVHGRAVHVDRTAFGITGSKGLVGRYLDLELDVLAQPE